LFFQKICLFKLSFSLCSILHLSNLSLVVYGASPADSSVAMPTAQAKEAVSGQAILLQAQNYYVQGKYSRAIALLNELLQNPQNLDIVIIHSNLAEVYRHLGQYSRAIQHWKKAIELTEARNDKLKNRELLALKIDLARAYTHQGQVPLAIPLLKEAIVGAKKERIQELENAAQRALGNAYKISGEYESAIIAYNTSLEKTSDRVCGASLKDSAWAAPNRQRRGVCGCEAVGDLAAVGIANRESKTKILNGLVEVYQLRSQQYFTEARGAILEKDRSLSLKYSQLAKKDRLKAIKCAKRAILISKNLTSLATARALINWRRLSGFAPKTEVISLKAGSRLSPQLENKRNFERVSSILEQLPASRSKVYLLISLAELEPQKAIEVLPQAIATASSLGDQRALSFALGALGNTYEKAGSLKQALFWTQKAQLAAQAVFAVDSLYRWQWQAGRIYRAMGAKDAAKEAYRGAIASVQTIRNDLISAQQQFQLDFRSQIEPIYRELLGLLLEGENKTQIEEALETADLLQVSQLQSYFDDDCLEIRANLPVNQTFTQKNTVLIRSIILNNKTYLILKLPNGTSKSYPVAMGAKQLQTQIEQWRYALEDISNDSYLPLSQSLYNLLIRPLAKDLAASNPASIIFINDGILNNVPMAALHDGKNFLIEKYAISYSLGLNSIGDRQVISNNLKTLAFGLTVPQNGFSALANVKQEIEGVEKLVGGSQLLDREFTEENFQQRIKENYPIVHIATHAQFGGSIENTFIQAFEQEISLTQLENILSSSQQPIELLVLSACQTAAGNERAVLGLAGVAARSKISNVVGSLWAVNDGQTVGLMEDFYKSLRSKSVNEALRSAQLKQIAQSLGHPGIWSSFILIES
jgi:CHAT domain-containing protein